MLIKLDELIEKYDIAFKGIIHIGAHHAEERDDYANHGVNRVIWIEANHRVFQFFRHGPSTQREVCQRRQPGNTSSVQHTMTQTEISGQDAPPVKLDIEPAFITCLRRLPVYRQYSSFSGMQEPLFGRPRGSVSAAMVV